MVVLFQSFNPPSDFPFVGLRVYLPQKAAGWWVVGLNGKYVNTELSRVEHGPGQVCRVTVNSVRLTAKKLWFVQIVQIRIVHLLTYLDRTLGGIIQIV